ncbi:GNAT family N-acetyltransferase [Shimia sp.]|uniref:GNAT family N-acetyltransferase n=1 Tax=Shimia sp. TaxID=1954381 RepID=UPI003BAD517E
MSWREVTESDLGWIEVFLRDHLQSSMFFLSSLADHGLGGAEPRALRVWALEGDQPGLFALSNEGGILLQAPDAQAADWAATAPFWQGRPLVGCLGESTQVAAFLAVSGLDQRPMSLNGAEPGYRLALTALRLPACDGLTLIPLSEAPRSLIESWRVDYHRTVMGTPEHARAAAAQNDIAGYLARDSHRVVMRGDVPVAMSGFNATLPDVVQIGGVYTPPELRGQGLARRSVALHLAEARDRGVTHSVLFAASPQAARAYEAIGFERNGSFSMMMFHSEESPANG